eukprot:228782-Pelagomonas_calceolata.AAC.1
MKRRPPKPSSGRLKPADGPCGWERGVGVSGSTSNGRERDSREVQKQACGKKKGQVPHSYWAHSRCWGDRIGRGLEGRSRGSALALEKGGMVGVGLHTHKWANKPQRAYGCKLLLRDAERKFFSRGKERGSKGLTGCRRVLMRTQTVDSSRERAASRRKGMLAGSTEKPCPYPGACTPSPGAWGVCVMLESCRGVSCPRCRDSSI